jgi:hypothetical protein
MRAKEILNEDWQKVNKRDKTDGMSSKAVKAYRRENPGSKLKTAVTTKPSKLKKGSKSAKRRKSFCARMSGMKKAHASAKTKRNPDSPINKALRRWNCESIEDMRQMIVEGEQMIAEIKKGQKDSNGFTKCWPGKHAEGTKKGKNGKPVRNCVPNENVTEDAEPMDREFALVKKLGRLGQRIVQNPKLWNRYEEENESGNPDWIISLIQEGTGATSNEVLRLSDLFGEIGGGMGRIIDFAWAVKEGHFEEDFLNPYREYRNKWDMAESSLEEYGDTAKGQKMLTKVQKRAVDRVTSKKADTDPKYAKKNSDTANRAWDRMTDKDLEEGKTVKQETPKPRNFVAKNAINTGAGAHKDKKKAAKQGDVKHKGKMMDIAEMEAVLEKASRALCTGGIPDKDLGASNLASCKSQGLRARDGEKSHLITAGARKVRIKVGGKKIKGRKYGGPLPDYGTRK